MSFLSAFRNWCTGPTCKQNETSAHNKQSTQNEKNKEKNKTRNRIYYPIVRNVESKKRRKFLGFGASGFTYGIYTGKSKHPMYVNRVSFKGNLNNARAIHNKAQSMARITGNNQQIVKIVEGFTVNDLPSSIPAHMINKIRKIPILSVIRMPYLGIDLFEAIKHDNNKTMIRKLPISTLMKQCYKLMKQIDALRGNQMYHGDIRLENITIHPETGEMTFIDFEFHEPFEVGFNKYIGIDRRLTEISERIPPEFLCVSAAAVAPYGIKHISKYYLNDRMLLFLWYINEKNAEKYFEDSYVSNMAFLYSLFEKNNNAVTKNEKISDGIMDYFDFFGFGIAMTIFFSTLFPINESSNNSSEMAAFYSMLQLLKSMCNFSIEERPYPDNILQEMQQIMKKIPKEARHTRNIPNVTSRVPNNSKATNQTAKSSKKRK
jgi:serine/threonine protein kinase